MSDVVALADAKGFGPGAVDHHAPARGAQLDEGAAESALTQVTAARSMIEPIEVPKTDAGATRSNNRKLEDSLNVAAAMERLGQGGRKGRGIIPHTVQRRWQTETSPSRTVRGDQEGKGRDQRGIPG